MARCSEPAVCRVPGDVAIPLDGGRTTKGVVRIGDTVRRPRGPHSPFVHALLRHLATKDFAGAPRLEGVDASGREILSYLPGDVPPELGVFSDRQLAAAARLIRRMHDATADAPFIDGSEVICHGDLSPCNCVFVDDLPIAFIDFDAARAGRRRDDVGYAAWLWLDLGNAAIAARAQGRRLAGFLDAYRADKEDAVMCVRDAQASLAARRTAPVEVRRWAARCGRWLDRHADAVNEGLASTTR